MCAGAARERPGDVVLDRSGGLADEHDALTVSAAEDGMGALEMT